MRKLLSLFTCLLLTFYTYSQPNYFPNNGVKDRTNSIHAFTNAKIIVSPTKTVNGSFLIEGDKIIAVGEKITIPKGAIIHDLKGKFVYASFIDPYSNYGITKKQESQGFGRAQILAPIRKGPYTANDAIRPDVSAVNFLELNDKDAAALRAEGIATTASFVNDGIISGTASLLSTGAGKMNEVLLQAIAFQAFSFNKGTSRQDYPSSPMGTIALLRQTHHNAIWYNSIKQNFTDLGLEAYKKNLQYPQIFASADKYGSLRIQKLGEELGIKFIVKGTGEEYQYAAELAKKKMDLIVPLDFPKAYEITDPLNMGNVSLYRLKHWELAPFNPYILDSFGISFSFTAAGLESPKQYLSNIKSAIAHGLSAEKALAAMTTNPAKILKVDNLLGTIEVGKIANFIISDTALFANGAIYSHWIQGIEYIQKSTEFEPIAGNYSINLGTKSAKLKITDAGAVTLSFDSTKVYDGKLHESSNYFHAKMSKGDTKMQMNIWSSSPQNISGTVFGTDWKETNFTAKLDSAFIKESKSKNDAEKKVLSAFNFPLGDYGLDSVSKSKKTYLIKSATIWTLEGKTGKEAETDILIKNGKIEKIGKNLIDVKAQIIDGKGLHVSPGIIDEHSHIAVFGQVNEGTNSVTSEVSIKDVINASDVNIYRQLAGGVTTSHILHGSANTIGGQTALLKLRWGKLPSELLFENADPFIKFALGENVKQSNWGAEFRTRFPRTRMGVEQVLVDAFMRAKEYEQEWKAYNSLAAKVKEKTPAPRKDETLETLVRILNDKQFITCHSYVQSEINMLMKVADSLGFRVNTFTHILEGYKVADKMKEHKAASSTFSDWWAYKYEVIDAIPQNAGILTRLDIVTAINSDDAEMARRLNQEAAKSVYYAGLSEVEALKLVTLNPAKMLHIDNRVGSLKEGKDADVVIWSANPLLNSARVLKTFVDGDLLFDEKTNEELMLKNKAERIRLFEKMADEGKAGKPTQKAKEEIEINKHCLD